MFNKTQQKETEKTPLTKTHNNLKIIDQIIILKKFNSFPKSSNGKTFKFTFNSQFVERKK